MPSPQKQPKQPHITVRFTLAQSEALDKAMSKYRRRTGNECDRAKALRDNGAKDFCEREGIAWPKEERQ